MLNEQELVRAILDLAWDVAYREGQEHEELEGRPEGFAFGCACSTTARLSAILEQFTGIAVPDYEVMRERQYEDEMTRPHITITRRMFS
jgi:hypothetical protein